MAIFLYICGEDESRLRIKSYELRVKSFFGLDSPVRRPSL